jgi:hypothetical protein
MLLGLFKLRHSVCTLLLLGAVTPQLPAANIGKGDVFGQGGYYTEFGEGGGTWAMVGGGAGGGGLPTLCQEFESMFGGFAPATSGFNALGQTGNGAGRS